MTICSFGFKYGRVPEADLVLDARRLPNPYRVYPTKTGLDPCVQFWLMARPETERLISHYVREIDQVLKKHPDPAIAVGCYGGRHRSVFVAEVLKSYYPSATVYHYQLSTKTKREA